MYSHWGFYPLNPVSNEYLLCSPVFDNTTIHFHRKKTFEIIAHKISGDAIFIGKLMWNGKLYKRNFITHNMIKQGGRMELWLWKMINMLFNRKS